MLASELTLASDGSLYHIHLNGETLADNVLLMGDPGRVDLFAKDLDHVEYDHINRELHAVTGTYHSKRLTLLSTGMGCDNIDIVMVELDAAANMNLTTGEPNPIHRSLNLVRLGTCGCLQPQVEVGEFIASRYAIGFDGLLHYYEGGDSCVIADLQESFCKHLDLPATMAKPYAVECNSDLLNRLAAPYHKGITATAPGFYAPQGRKVRIAPALTSLNEKLASFSWHGNQVLNFEMETSAIYGLSSLMGHNALSICMVVANRATGKFTAEHRVPILDLYHQVLDTL